MVASVGRTGLAAARSERRIRRSLLPLQTVRRAGFPSPRSLCVRVGLAGPLRVGLTQHTSSHNFGFALMDSFSLEVGAAAADSLPSVSGGGEGGGGGGGVCCSPLAGGGEGAGSTARWLPLLLLLPALAAALLGSRSDSWREGGAEAGAGDGSTKGKGSLEYGARERAAQSRGWAGVGAWRAATAQRVAPGGDELAEGGDEAAEDDGAAYSQARSPVVIARTPAPATPAGRRPLSTTASGSWRDSWYSALGYSRLPDEAEGRGGAGGSAAGSPTDSAPSSAPDGSRDPRLLDPRDTRVTLGLGTPSDWSREVGVGRFASFEATAGASFAEIALQGGPSQRLPAADGALLPRPPAPSLPHACNAPHAAAPASRPFPCAAGGRLWRKPAARRADGRLGAVGRVCRDEFGRPRRHPAALGPATLLHVRESDDWTLESARSR